MSGRIIFPLWWIYKSGAYWSVYKLDAYCDYSYNWVADFPSGAEAIAAFAAGGR